VSWLTIVKEFGFMWALKDLYYRMNWNTPDPLSVKDYLIRNIQIAQQHLDELPTFEGTRDDIMLQILAWVKANVTYMSDPKKFKLVEMWEDLVQEDGKGVLQTMTGDCETGATLIYALARLHRISPLRLRFHTGNVPVGGHAWLEYQADEFYGFDWWFTLDWCYHPDVSPFGDRATKDTSVYFKDWWNVTSLKFQ